MTDDVEIKCRRCGQCIEHSCASGDLKAALLALANYVPEGGMPAHVVTAAKKAGFFDEADRTAPLFTEAFLYDLFCWKDPARDVLSLLRRVFVAAGVDPRGTGL